jgi:protein-arginine kinase activator protein McsA
VEQSEYTPQEKIKEEKINEAVAREEKIKEAVAREDYLLAARIKQQMRASGTSRTTVSAAVWEASTDPLPSSATEAII